MPPIDKNLIWVRYHEIAREIGQQYVMLPGGVILRRDTLRGGRSPVLVRPPLSPRDISFDSGAVDRIRDGIRRLSE